MVCGTAKGKEQVMGIRQDQCNKVCRIIDDYLANRPRERDELIVAVRTVFKEADRKTENSSEKPNNSTISKMEQVDKDINVRSKDEPQTDWHYDEQNATWYPYKTDRDGDVWEWRGDAWYCIGQPDTPQTEVYDYKGNGKWERSE